MARPVRGGKKNQPRTKVLRIDNKFITASSYILSPLFSLHTPLPPAILDLLGTVLEDLGVQNFSAKGASPPPERLTRAIKFFFGHRSVTAMTFHKHPLEEFKK
jgi:hypothetical protein